MILVVGSTGFLGKASVRRLLQEGFTVRALTRVPERAQELRAAGAEIVQGDLCNSDSLRVAMEGCRIVVSAAHGLFGRGKYASGKVDDVGHRTLIDLARKSGVEHFIYTSIIDASPDHPLDFVRTKAKIEVYLRASGLPFTILRPTAFMEQHVHLFIGKQIQEKGKVILVGRGENPRNFVAAEDVAQLVVQAVKDHRFMGQIIEVGGPDNLSENQIVELYSRILGKNPKVIRIPVALLRFLATILHPIHPGIARIMRFSIINQSANATFDNSDLVEQYGILMQQVEVWVRNRVSRSIPG